MLRKSHSHAAKIAAVRFGPRLEKLEDRLQPGETGGNAYVTGTTDSPNFPTTPGAFKRRNRGTYDAFITKLAET